MKTESTENDDLNGIHSHSEVGAAQIVIPKNLGELQVVLTEQQCFMFNLSVVVIGIQAKKLTKNYN